MEPRSLKTVVAAPEVAVETTVPAEETSPAFVVAEATAGTSPGAVTEAVEEPLISEAELAKLLAGGATEQDIEWLRVSRKEEREMRSGEWLTK